MQRELDPRVAKQIDQRIAQEVKNFKEQIYTMNQDIQMLTAALATLRIDQIQKVAEMQSHCKQAQIQLENFVQQIKQDINNCFRLLDGYQTQINEQNKCLHGMLARVDQDCVSKEELSDLDIEITDRLDAIERKVDSLEKEMHFQNCLITGKITYTASALKDEITASFPSMEPIKFHVDSRTQELATDIAGFRKEIEIMKSRLHYGDKKFENIYTLIDRLKGK